MQNGTLKKRQNEFPVIFSIRNIICPHPYFHDSSIFRNMQAYIGEGPQKVVAPSEETKSLCPMHPNSKYLRMEQHSLGMKTVAMLDDPALYLLIWTNAPEETRDEKSAEPQWQL